MKEGGEITFLGSDSLAPNPIALAVGNEKLLAFSKGAHYTFFIFKKKKIAFDLGFCPMEAVPCTDVFITHAHEDHSLGIFRHIHYRKLFNLPPATYYFPEELVEPFQHVLEAWNRFNQRESSRQPVLIGLSPGQEVDVNRNVHISAFQTHHRGPSLGFNWFHPSESRTPFFSYLGDHTIESLKVNPFLGHSRNLAIELTFLEGEQEKARSYNHIHLNDIIELIKTNYFHNELIILKHLSSRYSSRSVQHILNSSLSGLNLPPITVI